MFVLQLRISALGPNTCPDTLFSVTLNPLLYFKGIHTVKSCHVINTLTFFEKGS
jgi:hypothetical protein